MPRVCPPAIALVPGFFGFDHRGDSTYFADRFVAGLRSVLEARGIRGIPVLSVSTLGIAGLWRRQADLLAELRALETPTADSPRLGGPRTWHLLGHSTGGVDAALLLRDAPLVRGPKGSTFGPPAWGEASDLVRRVSSVTTIAAPHFGTGLAESPLARFAGGSPSFRALRDMAFAALDVARRGDIGSRIRFALSATPELAKMPWFLVRMMLMNELARDLRPGVLEALSARPIRPSAEGRVFSVATVAPRPVEEHADKLFRDMWRWTHHGGRPRSAALAQPASRPAFHDLELRLPTQRAIELPAIDGGDNDGIASTERQVLGELIGLVIGDHVDVLGRYRRSSLVDGKVIDPGLLTSGAEFGDDEFFALLLRVGDRIAGAIKADAAAGER
jgi:pimeloyl-ACP methyl ester carboxylesterase